MILKCELIRFCLKGQQLEERTNRLTSRPESFVWQDMQDPTQHSDNTG